MRNLSERGAVPPETLRKYADIDQHLRRLEMKLREGTTRDVGQRGSNRVSQMAQQFLDRADRAPPAEKVGAEQGLGSEQGLGDRQRSGDL